MQVMPQMLNILGMHSLVKLYQLQKFVQELELLTCFTVLITSDVRLLNLILEILFYRVMIRIDKKQKHIMKCNFTDKNNLFRFIYSFNAKN